MQQKCEVRGCPNPARYKIYRYKYNGTKEWIAVCERHEGIIGNENMERAENESRHIKTGG